MHSWWVRSCMLLQLDTWRGSWCLQYFFLKRCGNLLRRLLAFDDHLIELSPCPFFLLFIFPTQSSSFWLWTHLSSLGFCCIPPAHARNQTVCPSFHNSVFHCCKILRCPHCSTRLCAADLCFVFCTASLPGVPTDAGELSACRVSDRELQWWLEQAFALNILYNSM